MKRVAIAVLLAAVPAAAEPDAKSAATAEAAAGQKLYAQNDFAGAASHFVRAFEIDPQPAFLFDAAQAYRFAKDCANAAKYFKQFIEVAQQAQAKNLDKVRKYLAEMEACAAPPAVTPEPTPMPAPAPEPKPASTSTTSLTLTPTLTPTTDRGAGRRHVGIGVAAAGAGLLVLGVVAQHWASTVESDRNAFAAAHCTPADPCAYATLKELDDKGHRDATVSAAAYGVGAAAVATGIVLYVLGRHDSGEQQLTVAPTSNGASVSVRF